MRRTNGEILRDLRKKENLTMEELANKLEVTASFVNAMEKDRKAIPEKIVEKMITILGATNKDLEDIGRNIIEKEVPEVLRGKVKLESQLTQEVGYKKFSYEAYILDSKSDGLIDKKKFVKHEEYHDIETGNRILNECIVLKIMGSEAQPTFFEDDIIAFWKTNFKNWQNLDKKVIIVKINNDLYVKKLIFENGEAFLYSFDDRLHKKQKVSEIKNIKYIAIAKYRLNINLDHFTL